MFGDLLQKCLLGQSCVSSPEQIEQSDIIRNMKNCIHIRATILLKIGNCSHCPSSIFNTKFKKVSSYC